MREVHAGVAKPDPGKCRGEEHLFARVGVGRVAQDPWEVVDDCLERPGREDVADGIAALRTSNMRCEVSLERLSGEQPAKEERRTW